MHITPINNGYSYISRQQATKNKNTRYSSHTAGNPAFGFKCYCPYSYSETYQKTFEKVTDSKRFFTSVYPDVANAVTHLLYGVRLIPDVKISPLMSKIAPMHELGDYDNTESDSFLSIDKIFDRIGYQTSQANGNPFLLASKSNGEKLIDCYSCEGGNYVCLTFFEPEKIRPNSDHRILITGDKKEANSGYSFELAELWYDSIRSHRFWPTKVAAHKLAMIKEYLKATGSGLATISETRYYNQDGSPKEFRNFLSDVFGI